MHLIAKKASTITQRVLALLSQRPQWFNVLFFLGCTRALLNVPAFLGANWFLPGVGIVGDAACPDSRSFPCLWASWDGDYYLRIARNGYSFHGVEVSFFPGYPSLTRLFALGDPSWLAWSGFLISNIAFIIAGLLLWHQVRLDFDKSTAWETIIVYTVFPTSVFFSAIYPESLFLLFSVLVYWLSARKQYILAGAIVSLAAVTRVNGLLLAFIPLVEIC